jgi:hypothetical protein
MKDNADVVLAAVQNGEALEHVLAVMQDNPELKQAVEAAKKDKTNSA